MNLTTFALSTVLATTVSILPILEPASAVNVKFRADHMPANTVDLDQNLWADYSEITNSANRLNSEYTWKMYQPNYEYSYEIDPNYWSYFNTPAGTQTFDTYEIGFRRPLEAGSVIGLYLANYYPGEYAGIFWSPRDFSFTAFEVGNTYDRFQQDVGWYDSYIYNVPGFFDWNGYNNNTYFSGYYLLEGTYTPTEPVPEPITIIGTLAALGFGLAFKKKASIA